mmetsp:Transcript_10983/g.16412  ORF Transcript_10983/g.16412 Transcript_10983/m.16412 type:complete len:466 (-) Transcript_10983:128-1525(-)|eukprot:CAMPEP_0167759586 /NCGR_PEP_ID=MMETSP0110_2-20121227/11107_1 /TAXON_ID=629695 /ORGANISM="Gymnochlora sp., Strain CCMP2014" /LENGTH=465 /DNA_ID=CAMNT_0007645991 /DNA_START=74 /DNA_END=1471 /DNA_ORIENTATION=+
METTLYEIKERPSLMADVVKLLQNEWQDADEENRKETMSRSDGESSFTLILLKGKQASEEKTKEIESKLEEKKSKPLEEKNDDVLLAHARLELAKLPYKNCKAATFYSVCVRKDLRGKGLGKIIMQKSAEYALKKGFGYCFLKTQKHNVGFYQKCGYTVCQDGKNPVGFSPKKPKGGGSDIHGALLADIRSGTVLRKATESKAKSPITGVWMVKSLRSKKKKKKRNRKKGKGSATSTNGAGAATMENEDKKAAELAEAVASFSGIDLTTQEVEYLGEQKPYGKICRLGQYFFNCDGKEQKRVPVRKTDRINLVKTFKKSPADKADWPNGLHCLTCPFTKQKASAKSSAFSSGCLALEQIVSRATGNPKQLAVRVMPVLIHPQAYDVIRRYVPGGQHLRPLSAGMLKNFTEAWNSSLGFRQYVTDDFVSNYSKRMRRGRKLTTKKDAEGNVAQIVFSDNDGKKVNK